MCPSPGAFEEGKEALNCDDFLEDALARSTKGRGKNSVSEKRTAMVVFI